MNLTELQRGVFHSGNSFGPEKSYLRKNGGYYDEDLGSFVFFRGMEFNTLTFYNAFSVAKWRSCTGIDSLYLRLGGRGTGLVQLRHALPGNTEITLAEQRVELSADGAVDLEIPGFAELTTGLAYFNFLPLEDGALEQFGFFTASQPLQEVRLGLVITHFNRQAQVASAAARIQDGLIADPEFAGKIDLFVIDNSSNCGLTSSDTLHVIENQNLGGSGGFSRGLLTLWQDGGYSHCLFMDDDASCEIESLRRAYRIMMFCDRDKVGIAGALLDLNAPSLIMEKGAYFNGICNQLHPELDISTAKGTIEAEQDMVKPNYGGWWFFGFRLSDVDYFPFPFFVRGDDTTFSMVNEFHILTMNGICSYGESFALKNSVMPTYLDTRGHLVKQIAVLDHGLLRVMKGISRFVFMALLSYNYGSARASILAFEDISRGTDFFLDNMDMQSRFPVIKEFSKLELARECDADELSLVIPGRDVIEESLLRKLFRFATLNGALLPGLLWRDAVVYQEKSFRASFREVFRYRHVFYASPPLNSGYVATFDRGEFFRSSARFLLLAAKFALNFRSIKEEYRRNMPGIMSSEFWQKTYPGGPAETDYRQ